MPPHDSGGVSAIDDLHIGVMGGLPAVNKKESLYRAMLPLLSFQG